MDGIFSKSKGVLALNIGGVASGMLILAIFGLMLAFGAIETIDHIVGTVFFCGFATFDIIYFGRSWYADRKAFIHVDEARIRAYCHIGSYLDCEIRQVREIRFLPNGMHIWLNDGKHYLIAHLRNGYQLQQYIYDRRPKEPMPVLDKEQTIAQLKRLKKKQKPAAILSSCAFLLVFPTIIGASWLTGWKELGEFYSRDWVIFAVMGVSVVALFVVFARSLRRYANGSDEAVKLSEQLSRQILLTAPATLDNPLYIYVDDETPYSRVTVYGILNSEKVYSAVEEVDPNFQLFRTEISEIYPNMDALLKDLDEDLIEIPVP